MMCSTLASPTRRRAIGATFMKFGRVPTTDSTRGPWFIPLTAAVAARSWPRRLGGHPRRALRISAPLRPG